ncbi:MAG: exodeoxyribonuclease III [Gemmatimonadales bacterium]|nr:exodeoxyribonuclease III [Gemmatimonadales bacterium]
MKIISWNVNSIRTRLPRTLALLERHRPDVLCLQETKVRDEDFPADEIAATGYCSEIFGQKTYNGVAILTRTPMSGVTRGFQGDPAADQARVIGGEVAGVRILNLYVINGEAVDSPKYQVKLTWLDAVARWLEQEFDPAQPLLLVGDFNVAPDDRDVHDPEKWRGRVHCSEPERERLHTLQSWGLADVTRSHHPEGGPHTWWDYRGGAFHRGWGLRIDLALATDAIAARCLSVEIDREERKPSSGEGKPSDHAPLIVQLA